jgi:hypothetical protein
MVSGLLYLLAVLVLFVLDLTGTLALRRVLTWPVAVVAILWFYGVPLLLWRTNSCRGCGQRMDLALIEGRAPH